MLLKLASFSLATIQCILIQSLTASKCFDNSIENIHTHFSTKTPYRFIRNTDSKQIEYPDCTPVKVWGIVRHGSRTPSKKLIFRMKTDLINIRNKILTSDHQLCGKDLIKFRNWNPVFEEFEAKYLVATGEDELVELGERMQTNFPEVFPDYFDNSTYKFKFTNTQRTQKSFEGFATGLFGRHNLRSVTYDQPLSRDPILRFYKLCKKWKNEIDKNPQTFEETRKFRETTLVKDAVKTVASKLGIPSNELRPNDVHLMYMTCAFETAMHQKNFSPWCSLFDSHTIQIFEFLEDLEYYWVDGYGYPLTYNQACPAIKDMIARINPNATTSTTTVYFTHSGTILKLLAKLNLYKDDLPLVHTDFKYDRKWRVSKIDAFASNIFFITFDCGDAGYKVLALHQEQPVFIPGCDSDSYFCCLEVFLKLFKKDVDNCQFDEMCSN